MPKCAECSASCENEPLVLEESGHQLSFCSLECVIAHSVKRVCRRIAGQNRRMRRYLDNADSERIGPRRAAKLRIK